MNKIFQHGTLELIMAGLYDGTLTFSELLENGDTGIGTTHGLDGEVTIIDGHAYQTKSSGETVEIVDLNTTTPFASAHKSSTNSLKIKSSPLTFNLLDELINQQKLTNSFLSIRAHGTIKNLQVRVAPKQNKPYPDFSTVAASQPVFNYENVTGTLVGDFGNDLYTGVMAGGWHIHFISDDRTIGGHVLYFDTDNVDLEIYVFDTLNLHLPTNNTDFTAHDVNFADLQAAIAQAEK
ncbi:acetolactate decarboxylase [Weissella paramesenteroides]|uniref:acetolactate decarboxylase n=1 Tax=Weissella paramesenteroides TaxID=1249 RepID=UPI00103C1F96|nr:acetolactate decarboxylase [Weissella paramesenteroides]RZQ57969.1 acetolactate decarboxylase [Weissella paramesenteroides]